MTVQGYRTRFLHHLYEARSGSEFPIHRAIRKYGEGNFLIEVIESLDDIKTLKDREIFWILELKSKDREFGYNLTAGGDGTLGRKLSDITKNKIREKAIGRKLSDETKKRMSDSGRDRWVNKDRQSLIDRNANSTKVIYRYTLNKKECVKFDSIKSAAKSVNVSQSWMSEVSSLGKSCRGYMFSRNELIMDIAE